MSINNNKITTYLYPITIEPCEDGGYFASCPILQGCHAEGETYGEALDAVRDVMIVHISARKANNEPLPAFTIEGGSEQSV